MSELLHSGVTRYLYIVCKELVASIRRALEGGCLLSGKTIQTIALLAHLACDKGVWGPHLIVVPTSVMLNWELELKRWCPAFKVLTYFGTLKERKTKRTVSSGAECWHSISTQYSFKVGAAPSQILRYV